MRYLPEALLILAAPVGVAGYLLGGAIMGAIPAPEPIHGFLVAFGPLLVAGICILPLLIPFFDRMAKRDLAAAPSRQTDGAPAADATPKRRSGDRKRDR